MIRSDAASVKRLIDKTLLSKSVQKIYEPSEITVWNDAYTLEALEKIAEDCHAYLLFDKSSDRLLASGYIRLNADKRSAHLGMVFTDPEFSKMGLGKSVIAVLERDEYAKSVDKIELDAAVSAYRFYRKSGYTCRDNTYQIEVDPPTNSYSVPMEKFADAIGKPHTRP